MKKKEGCGRVHPHPHRKTESAKRTRLSGLTAWTRAAAPEPLLCLAATGNSLRPRYVINSMMSFLLWCLLLVVCWPLALLALLLYPLVWLLLLPFRLLGIAVEGVFELLRAIILLPARLLGGRPRRA